MIADRFRVWLGVAEPEVESIAAAFRASWPALATLIALSLLGGGLEIGTRNHVVQIPVVLKTLDPELFDATSFGENLSRYRSLFWLLVAHGARHLGLTTSLVVAHILGRAILLCGIFGLAISLFKRRDVALVAVLLTMFDLGTILVTHTSVADRVPTHTVFAIALSAWALMFFWENRPIACAVVMGLICQMHLMHGMLLAVVFAVAVLFEGRRLLTLRWLAALALWGLLSASAILWALATPPPDVDSATYLGVLRSFFSRHLFPLSWSAEVWFRCGGLIVALALCLAQGARISGRRILWGTLLGIGFTWATGVIVSLVPTFQHLVLLQWFRTSGLLVLLLVPLMAYAALELVPKRKPMSAAALSAALAASWGAAHGVWPGLLFLTVCGVTVAFTQGSAAVADPWQRELRRAAVCLSATMIGMLGWNIWNNGLAVRTQPTSWIEVQQWARESTAKDAVFLTPMWSAGFRVHSARDVYFSPRNRGAVMLSPHHTSEVMRKHAEVVSLGFFDESLEDVSWPHTLEFCRERGIRYVVLPAAMRVQSAPVYQNSAWSVYRVSVAL